MRCPEHVNQQLSCTIVIVNYLVFNDLIAKFDDLGRMSFYVTSIKKVFLEKANPCKMFQWNFIITKVVTMANWLNIF